ncbi:ribosomal-processing cysteine protease Prp [Williamsoniiplasma lucivorax]|uniref:Ribosomal processing cysteine protease Prp n=1 Tax=Williamsoniiplasma lucivorax TaxID=209274 RepID=A0A2S5REP3_9MOLU|nr:ribosomal-processing cysteine protease Prp [Williamsoniiplasma lucivorax]PPE05784.1 hypothetical protein ELUCI_v1c00720 [Williamsoniiplasma lucivorax]
MVKIKITYHNSEYQKLTMSGHALAGAYGQDLVCAALTGIVSGALNAFDQKFTNDIDIIVEENLIEITIKKSNPTIQTMFELLEIQLQTIVMQYPKNVELKEVR